MELQQSYEEIRAHGAQLLAISVDTLDDASRMAGQAGATFPVLADEDRVVTKTYGLFDLLSDGVAAPATLILDRDGNLAASYVGASISDRVPATAIIAFLEGKSGAPIGTRG